jgi:soluble lytic murein transglycosylase-like protein
MAKWHLMKARRFSCFALFFSIFSTCSAGAAPVPLTDTVELKATLKRAAKNRLDAGGKKDAELLPPEYSILVRARALLKSRNTVATMEEIQKEMLLSRLSSLVKGVEREFEDYFYAFEIKKGIAYTKRHLWKSAYDSFQRGIGGLGPFKWPLYWREEASQQLSILCGRDPKTKDDACLALARRVADGFPKAALETKLLRELPLPDSGAAQDFGGDRLSQAYSERTERDDIAFQAVLEAYLQGKESVFKKELQEFLSDFPKSSLRFRARFLQAELLWRSGSKKEAAPIYQSIIEETPLSYYSIVSSERLGTDLKARIKKDSILVDLEVPTWNEAERSALARALLLLQSRRFDELGFELEGFNRTRNYSNDFLLYLMRVASVGNQHMITFKLANELIQRKAPQMQTEEMLDLLFPEVYANEIHAEAAAAGLDPVLVMSLIKQESGFKPGAISSSGALGLMQLMPFTAIDVQQELKLHTLVEPLVNVSIGVRYLKSLMDRYDGNVPYALAAYNAGPHRVARWRKDALPSWTLMDWIESIPFKETRDYVSSILRHRYWYQVQKGQPVSKITELKTLTTVPPVDKN